VCFGGRKNRFHKRRRTKPAANLGLGCVGLSAGPTMGGLLPQTYKSGTPNPSSTLCLFVCHPLAASSTSREAETATAPVLGSLTPRRRDPQAVGSPPVTKLRRLLLSPSSDALPATPQVVARKARAATAADLAPLPRGPKQRRPRYERRPWYDVDDLAARSSSGTPTPGSDSDDGGSGTLTSSPPRFGLWRRIRLPRVLSMFLVEPPPPPRSRNAVVPCVQQLLSGCPALSFQAAGSKSRLSQSHISNFL